MGWAQETVPAAGGNISGNSGSVSYTLGQVSCSGLVSTGGQVNQGVQQPYEFFTIGTDENNGIRLSMSVYPNPALSSVNLILENQNIENVSFLLYNLYGELLLKEKVNGNTTCIPVNHLPSGSYLLKVVDDRSELKTFKIIKTE